MRDYATKRRRFGLFSNEVLSDVVEQDLETKPDDPKVTGILYPDSWGPFKFGWKHVAFLVSLFLGGALNQCTLSSKASAIYHFLCAKPSLDRLYRFIPRL